MGAAPGVNATLFAYSALAAGDMAASARPAIAFTLSLSNAAKHPANATLLLNMPLQVETDQVRPGAPLVPATKAADGAACAELCQQHGACRSWNFQKSAGSCQLCSGVGLNRYMPGTDSGVRGRWSVDSDGKCVTLVRAGDTPVSGSVSLCTDGAGASAGAHSKLGNVLGSFGEDGTLGLSDGANGEGQQGAVLTSSTIAPMGAKTISLTMGWRFPNRDWYNYDCDTVGYDTTVAAAADLRAEDGGFAFGCPPCKNKTTGAPVARKKCAGVEERNTYCPADPAPHQCNPGGCNPPPRDGWSATTCGGRDEIESTNDGGDGDDGGASSYAYLNRYAELYPTSREAAWAAAGSSSMSGTLLPSQPSMAEELAATLEAIDAVHSVLMESSLPEWLQDQLVNSVSHVRNGYWFANSSCPLCVHSLDPKVRDVLWRQFEAFDCTDLDSVHNDGERHVPYLMLFPDAERSKMAAWAHNQAPKGWAAEGMLAEQIHQVRKMPSQPRSWANSSLL